MPILTTAVSLSTPLSIWATFFWKMVWRWIWPKLRPSRTSWNHGRWKMFSLFLALQTSIGDSSLITLILWFCLHSSPIKVCHGTSLMQPENPLKPWKWLLLLLPYSLTGSWITLSLWKLMLQIMPLVLLSIQTNSSEIHPIAFHSHTFSSPKLNYDTHDKELLAIFKAFCVWKHYPEGSGTPIDVVTDHKNLEYFSTTKVLTCQ